MAIFISGTYIPHIQLDKSITLVFPFRNKIGTLRFRINGGGVKLNGGWGFKHFEKLLNGKSK